MARVALCLVALLCCCPLLACAVAPPAEELQSVEAALSMSFPNIPLKQLNPTPVEGIYELVTDKDEILYFAPRSGHILAGELWNNLGQNLTRESKGRMMTEKLSMLPLDKAIKIGDGPNQVVEVSDPDCPFCRDGSAFFSAREDVTRYVFLFPLDRIHPQAVAKSSYILSAADQETAYEDVFTGKYDNQPLPEFTDNGLLEIHRQAARAMGINSTPRFWINGQYISGTNLQEFEKLLDQGPSAGQ